VIPDDTAGRPLTAAERAAIEDLEVRIRLNTPVPGHDRRRRGRLAAVRRQPGTPRTSAAPLVGLLGTAAIMTALILVGGGGLLGVTAVLASVAATALLWPLLPAGLGGPVRPPGRPSTPRGRRPGHA
jgi:hypothetical protein